MALTLLPMPRQVEYLSGETILPGDALIVIPNSSLFFEAQSAQRALAEFAGLSWPIVAGSDYARAGLSLTINPEVGHKDGYRLDIIDGRISIQGADVAGVFYGVGTLRQLMQQHGTRPPAIQISDWPDFLVRGVLLDISRDKVPTLRTTLDLVEQLATWKINQVQLYMEHTFAYRKYPQVWAQASPFTGQEILELDAFCRQRHIDLVPSQNSLGHMERWLKLEPYRQLAECPDGFERDWEWYVPPAGWNGLAAPTTLDPQDARSIELVSSLYDELLPHFSSKLFNVGGDEPWELGKGKSKAAVATRGGHVYVDYILKLHQRVTARGRQMQFWGDIIVNYPELVSKLPRDVIALEWGYEADHPFDRHGALFENSGVSFYVCPGTSSWNSLAGRTDNALENLRNAAQNGLRHGALGFLNTDWGDSGHWQPLPSSFLGLACGAALSWAYDANQSIDLPRALDLFAFEDRAGFMGRLAYDLGNVYLLPGLRRDNGTRLFDVLQNPLEYIQMQLDSPGKFALSADTLRSALVKIEEIMRPLDSSDMLRKDAALIRDEFRQVANLMRHACRRTLLAMGEPDVSVAELHADLEALVARQRENWLARNRPGGLDDSLARFDLARQDYAEAY